MNQDLIQTCQMFLVPASILFAALGIAKTEPLKTLISGMGLAISLVWFYRIISWAGLTSADEFMGLNLAAIFLAASFVFVCVHAHLWWRQEHRPRRRRRA